MAMVTPTSNTATNIGTAIPTLSVVTVTIAPLTTTFTPPATCTEMHLTQLASPGYQIWLNEPQPVPGSKIGDCYPSQWIQGYTSVINASSSIAPMFSPLVCPEGMVTAKQWDNGYIACCNEGFELHTPDTPLISSRPAYGATCYSNIPKGAVMSVTAYDNQNVTATVAWSASVDGDQVYAHPIDGFMLSTSTSNATAAQNTMSTVSTGSSPNSSNGLSTGLIAGILVACVVGGMLILSAVFYLIHRRRQLQKARRASIAAKEIAHLDTSFSSPPSNIDGLSSGYPAISAVSPRRMGTIWESRSTPTWEPIEHFSPSELPQDGKFQYELESAVPTELDGGFIGYEAQSRELPLRHPPKTWSWDTQHGRESIQVLRSVNRRDWQGTQ